MSTVVIEHVKVGDLPAAWRDKIAAPEDARVTVRIEEEPASEKAADEERDSAFGMWCDRADMADVAAYVRSLRTPRFGPR
jgi:diaminopimelate decarboxylase